MVAAKNTLPESNANQMGVCRECGGSGTVSRWSEIAFFEDLRPCTQCEAGFKIDSKIADIVKRAELEERLARK